MSGLYILLAALAFFVVLALLGGWLRDLRASVEAERETLERRRPAATATAKPAAAKQAEVERDPPPEETAVYWWKLVLRPLAILGALLIPVQAVVLLGRSSWPNQAQSD